MAAGRIGEPQSAQQNGTLRIADDPPQLKLLPVLGLGTYLQRLHYFHAEVSDGRWQHAVRGFPALMFVNLGAEFPGASIPIEQLHG